MRIDLIEPDLKELWSELEQNIGKLRSGNKRITEEEILKILDQPMLPGFETVEITNPKGKQRKDDNRN
jgi:hypothetical protein